MDSPGSSIHTFNTVYHNDSLEDAIHVGCCTTSGNQRLIICFRYNKYAQITARALRASLKEEERVVAEKRGLTSVRYQKWENGVGGQQVRRSFP